MIKSLTVTNYLGESIKLELEFPEKSGFSILNIDGLGPSKANINVRENTVSDGGQFNSSRVEARNIVLTLKFLEAPTIENTRLLSYKYFPIKKYVRLLFETDSRTCETYGYVESNEPNIFSKNETTQISIICPDPYFYSTKRNKTIFYGVESAFEFPFSNESLNENLIEFGIINNKTTNTVYYTGDAEVGILITLHAIGDVSNVTIYNTRTREVMKINTVKLAQLTGSGIIFGDSIIISTNRGAKSIFLLRNGEYTNILNCLDKGSNWFQLAKGDNLFAYTADTGAINLQFTIDNQIAYEGV